METTALKNLNAEVERDGSATRAQAVEQERIVRTPSELLRVAHVMPWPGLGGVATAQLRLARALEETNDFRNLAFCHGHKTKVGEMFEDEGIEVVAYEAADYSYRRALGYLGSSIRFARLLREHKIDVIHAADLMGVYHASLATRMARVPLVCHIRSNFEDFPARYKPPLRLVDHFVFVSRAVWKNFDTIFRVPEKRGSVIYDWGPQVAEDESARVARSRVRAEFRIDEDAPVIGMIARVQPPKDFCTLIRATAEVVRAQPRTRLLIVGEYDHPHCMEHYGKLCNLIEELQLTKHVVWTGLRADVWKMIRAMDVCVLSTEAEGMPLVLLEAMSLGCPVVATRVGGIPELVTHNETGLLHERGDFQGLAQGILSLLDHPERAQHLGARGAAHVRANFSQEKTVNATRALYARLRGADTPCTA